MNLLLYGQVMTVLIITRKMITIIVQNQWNISILETNGEGLLKNLSGFYRKMNKIALI